MNTHRSLALTLAVASLLSAVTARADVTLETNNLRLVIAAEGVVKSLVAKDTGAEYAWTNEPGPVAVVYRGGEPSADYRAILADASNEIAFADNEAPVYHGGEALPANGVALEGDRLTIHFAKCDVVAVYKVKTTPTYLALELVSLDGGPIDRIDLLHLRVKRLPYLGMWINAAYDDRFGVCLCAGNVKTNAGMNRHEGYVDMQAMAEHEVTLVGTTAVLFGFDWHADKDFLDPQSDFLDKMEIVERDFGMPSGAKRRRLPIQRESYISGTPTPKNIDQHIDLAKRLGYSIVEVQWEAFSTGPGHFKFKSPFDRGVADLKAMTDKIRAAGLHASLHLHFNKTTIHDSYVTPVPDDRLHARRRFTLAEPIDAKAETILVREKPEGCDLKDGQRLLKIGKELVQYKSYTSQPPFAFQGCQRGHLNTTAAAHAPGDTAGLLDVDDWWLFIRYDQTTDIQEETARRIAEIYEATGPYDFMYFDGSEDVHWPYWYHVSNSAYQVYRLWKREPLACEAACNTHFGWHMSTRGNAYDGVEIKDFKDFVHKIACRSAPAAMCDFTRINFGWLYPVREIAPDILEYVASRGAAWDCATSLLVYPEDLQAVPGSRWEDGIAVLRRWEEARRGGRITEAERRMLRTLDPSLYRFISCRIQERAWAGVPTEPGLSDAQRKQLMTLDQEHHLLVNETGGCEVVPIDEIGDVAGGKVRAYRFRRAPSPKDTWVLLWAVKGSLDLRLNIPSERLAAMQSPGKPLPTRTDGKDTIIRVGNRMYLRLPSMKDDDVDSLMRRVRAE
jgi:hypothetical protein